MDRTSKPLIRRSLVRIQPGALEKCLETVLDVHRKAVSRLSTLSPGPSACPSRTRESTAVSCQLIRPAETGTGFNRP